MGLLGNLLSGATAPTSKNQNAVGSIIDLLNDNKVGGLDGVVGKMTQAGLGNIVDSWVSTGKNKSVKSGAIANILGSEVVAQLASKLGISNAAAASKLAAYLPMIIDKLTPDGKITSASQGINVQDILGQILKR